MKAFLCSLILLVVTIANATDFTHTWNGAEVTRSYNSVAPGTSCSSQGMAVVLDPDGTGYSGDLSALAEAMCILVVCPLSTNGWQSFLSDGDSEDVDFIAELIRSLQASHSTPVENVVITGFSFGGSMSYRVWCERSDVVTGIVVMAQTFLEPAAGHLEKDQEVTGQTATETVLDKIATARQTSDKCDPEFKRPHYAVVGTTDNYYGEVGRAYNGKLLWEPYCTCP